MTSRNLPVLLVTGILAVPAALLGHSARSAETAVVLPPPTADLKGHGVQKLVVAGGCFWGVQAVFQHVKGVTSAVSGYAGGSAKAANYTAVSTGRTGHAEAVEITYDPSVVSAGTLLRVFFSVAHDPTEHDRQGPDVGTQYRSGVFPGDAAQANFVASYVSELEAAKAFRAKIVTKIEPQQTFYPAETYHQDYLTRHPNNPYIVFNDRPKLEALKTTFPELYRPDPKLVASGS